MQVAIFGAGPAGMSCANALLTFGLEPVVIERADHVGGAQRTNFHPNLWFLGAPLETGIEMTARIVRHYHELGVATHLRAELAAAQRVDGRFRLRLATPEGERAIEAGALVLATGMRPRTTPELEALARKSRRVIIGPLSVAIRDDIRDGRVLILGGGDNALDHALFLAERGNRVRVCARRRLSARRPFRDACAARPQIELVEHCERGTIEASDAAVRVGEEAFDWLLVMYGYQPNIEWLARFAPEIRPRLTPSGHVQVDLWQRSSVPGVYAIGDLTDSPQPSVPTAIAQGLAAARAIERDSQRD